MNTEKLFAELNASPELTTAINDYTDRLSAQNIRLREEVIALRQLCNSVINNTSRSGPHILQTLRDGLAKIENSV